MYDPSMLCAFELATPAALTPLFPKPQRLTFETTIGLDPTGLKYVKYNPFVPPHVILIFGSFPHK